MSEENLVLAVRLDIKYHPKDCREVTFSYADKTKAVSINAPATETYTTYKAKVRNWVNTEGVLVKIALDKEAQEVVDLYTKKDKKKIQDLEYLLKETNKILEYHENLSFFGCLKRVFNG